MGRKKQPHYRVVVADGSAPRDGRFVESLGYYKPLSEPARLVLDLERTEYWIGQGATPSHTVRSLVKKARLGGGPTLALGEPDVEAKRAAEQEAMAARRKAEADAAAEAKAAAEAEEAEAKAAEEAKAKADAEAVEKGEGEKVEETEAEAEPAPEASGAEAASDESEGEKKDG